MGIDGGSSSSTEEEHWSTVNRVRIHSKIEYPLHSSDLYLSGRPRRLSTGLLFNGSPCIDLSINVVVLSTSAFARNEHYVDCKWQE